MLKFLKNLTDEEDEKVIEFIFILTNLVHQKNKPLNLLHIHFRGQEGEARMHLPNCQVE